MDGFDEYEQLTPEEIEMERRRKAAARRRKMAAREARRRKRRREAIIRCSILLIILILLIVGFVKMVSGIWNHFHDKPKKSQKVTEQTTPTTEEVTEAPITADIDEAILAKDLPADRDTAIEMLKMQATTDPDLQTLVDNIAVYPDNILMNLAVNSEMKQFAIDYPAKINVVFDGAFNVDFTSDTVPLFLQFDEQWGYADYAKNIIGLSGSAPTCLSMAYTYLKQDGSMNPIKVADFSTEKGYVNEDGNTSWSLMTDGATELGLGSTEFTGGQEELIDALQKGDLIICALTPGDFTKTETFILIREYRDGLFYVNDPNSEARSQVGWDFPRLESQIAKMWEINGTAVSQPDENNDNGEDANDTNNGNGTGDATNTGNDNGTGAADGAENGNDAGDTDNTNGDADQGANEAGETTVNIRQADNANTN